MRPTFLLQIFLGCIVFATGCTSNNYTSTITSLSYDERKDLTQFLNLPYGSVSIPGNWKEKRYNASSREYFFVNNDSVIIAIRMRPWNKYEFYTPQMDETRFIDEYYEWDSKYAAGKIQGHRSVLKRDASRNYLVWHLWNDSTSTTSIHVNNYLLFGMKNKPVKTVYSVCVFPENTEKWNESQKLEFLESVFLGAQ